MTGKISRLENTEQIWTNWMRPSPWASHLADGAKQRKAEGCRWQSQRICCKHRHEQRRYLSPHVSFEHIPTMPWDNSSSDMVVLVLVWRTRHKPWKAKTHEPDQHPAMPSSKCSHLQKSRQDFTFSACCLELRIQIFWKTTCFQILAQIRSKRLNAFATTSPPGCRFCVS